MKICKIELFVMDSENSSDDDIKTMLENVRYLDPKVISLDSRIVEWTDEHPLNKESTFDLAYKELFSKPQVPAIKVGDIVVKHGDWPKCRLTDGQFGTVTQLYYGHSIYVDYGNDHKDYDGVVWNPIIHPWFHLEQGSLRVTTKEELAKDIFKSVEAMSAASKTLELAKEIATERLKGVSAAAQAFRASNPAIQDAIEKASASFYIPCADPRADALIDEVARELDPKPEPVDFLSKEKLAQLEIELIKAKLNITAACELINTILRT